MTKTCTKCKVSKPVNEFHRMQSAPDGYNYQCKVCRRDYRRANDQLPHNLLRTKTYHFQYKYGITADKYQEMLHAQGGVCAICQKPEVRKGRSGKTMPLCVDHNHDTGAVRGLLCHACNVSLGQFYESVEVLQRAIDYLQAQGVIISEE